VLPKGFHCIRQYGLFASATRAESIATARTLLNVANRSTRLIVTCVTIITGLVLRDQIPSRRFGHCENKPDMAWSPDLGQSVQGPSRDPVNMVGFGGMVSKTVGPYDFFNLREYFGTTEVWETSQMRGPRTYRIRKKLFRALQHLTDGRPLSEAAALARMTPLGLKRALRKPHVEALLAEFDGGPGCGSLPMVVSTFERLMDLRLRQQRLSGLARW
jgi:hypothetical protein